jgi:hypothetical protein
MTVIIKASQLINLKEGVLLTFKPIQAVKFLTTVISSCDIAETGSWFLEV